MRIIMETMEESIMVMARTLEAITIHMHSTTKIKVVHLIMYRRNSSTDLPASRRKSERFILSPYIENIISSILIDRPIL